MRPGSIIVLDIIQEQPHLCWNRKWAQPYESMWSVFEKLKFANQMNTRDILNQFGASHVINRRVVLETVRDGNLISLEGFDIHKLSSFLGFSPHEVMNQFFERSVYPIPNMDSSVSVRHDLTYCSVCMVTGFHSILHQLTFIKKCPFHEVDLIDECPQCKANIRFGLSDKFTVAPYQCKCGYSYYKPKQNYACEWSKRMEVKDRVIGRWLSLTDQELSVVRKMITLKSKEYSFGLHEILAVIDESYFKDLPYHYVCKSSKNLLRYNNRVKDYLQSKQSKSEESFLRLLEQVHKELFRNTKKTYKAILQHLKRTVLSDHIQCIEEMRRTPWFSNEKQSSVCSLAYAYLHWRKSVESQKSARNIDVGPLLDENRVVHFFHPVFYSAEHTWVLSQVLKKWVGNNDARKCDSIAATNWVLNKVLGIMLFQHFYDWVEYASKEESQIDEQDYIPRNYVKTPRFLIKPPYEETKYGEFEFHWWSDLIIKRQEILKSACCARRATE